MVAQPPVMLDKDDKMSQDLSLPWTPYGKDQISPEPPALEVIVMTTATEVVMTRTV